mgnify:CR=1 FL=1
MRTLEVVADRFFVPLVPEKSEGLAATLTFLGIELDPVKMVSRLPRDKLEVLRGLLDDLNG